MGRRRRCGKPSQSKTSRKGKEEERRKKERAKMRVEREKKKRYEVRVRAEIVEPILNRFVTEIARDVQEEVPISPSPEFTGEQLSRAKLVRKRGGRQKTR